MAKYKVLVPVAYVRGGKVSRHRVGDVVELDDQVAVKLYRKLEEIAEQPTPPPAAPEPPRRKPEPKLTETEKEADLQAGLARSTTEGDDSDGDE